MTYKQTSMLTPGAPSGALAMHRDSRGISKIQPKIRIIHIFAPEIIKTDVANFRELVQRLTGKPSAESAAEGKGKGKGKGKKAIRASYDQADIMAGARVSCDKPTVSTKLEVMMGTGSSSSPSSSSDHQQEVWRSNTGDHNNISGGYLTAFTDLDDNFDFSTVFHMGPADGSSHINSFGENTHQLAFRG